MGRPFLILGIALLLVMDVLPCLPRNIRTGQDTRTHLPRYGPEPAAHSSSIFPYGSFLPAGTPAGILPFDKTLGIPRVPEVSGENVLEQGVRAQIYEYLAEPGYSLRGLAEEMGISMGTLRYHLNILRDTHKITLNEGVASVRFYENNGWCLTAEQHILKHLPERNHEKDPYDPDEFAVIYTSRDCAGNRGDQGHL